MSTREKPKTSTSFLNKEETLLQLKDIGLPTIKAYNKLKNFGDVKDSYEEFKKSGNIILEIPKGANVREIYSTAVGKSMDEGVERTAFSKLKKAVSENTEDIEKVSDKFAMAYMLNEEVFNLERVAESFSKRYEYFVNGNPDNVVAQDTQKKALEQAYDSVEKISNELKEKGVIKVSEKGNMYLDINRYQKSEILPLIRLAESDLMKDLPKALEVGNEKKALAKASAENGVNIKVSDENIANVKTEETETQKAKSSKAKNSKAKNSKAK